MSRINAVLSCKPCKVFTGEKYKHCYKVNIMQITLKMEPRRRWKDNNKMYLQEVGWEGMDWIDMAQDRDR
jgi:hypothetical protein